MPDRVEVLQPLGFLAPVKGKQLIELSVHGADDKDFWFEHSDTILRRIR